MMVAVKLGLARTTGSKAGRWEHCKLEARINKHVQVLLDTLILLVALKEKVRARCGVKMAGITAACVHVCAACGTGLDFPSLTKVALQLRVSRGGWGARTPQQCTCLFVSSDM
jgi:hypothetical protein